MEQIAERDIEQMMERVVLERLHQGTAWLSGAIAELRRRWEREGYTNTDMTRVIEGLMAKADLERDGAVAELVVWSRLLPIREVGEPPAAGGKRP